MQPRVLQRFALTALLVLGAGVSVVSTAAARPSRPAPRTVTRGGFNLFAGVRGLRLNGNRWDCDGITNFGNICTDLSGSGTVEGGYLAQRHARQLHVQRRPADRRDGARHGVGGTGPGWIGDTVGVFFMDPRGDQREGDAVTNIYSSINSSDVAVWPTAGYVKDSSLYSTELLGRLSISQQDTWVRYWDGDPALSAGRNHMMGVLVEQRGLLWNFPSGNQDILYFLFRFINITSTNAADYAGLADAGYRPATSPTSSRSRRTSTTACRRPTAWPARGRVQLQEHLRLVLPGRGRRQLELQLLAGRPPLRAGLGAEVELLRAAVELPGRGVRRSVLPDRGLRGGQVPEEPGQSGDGQGIRHLGVGQHLQRLRPVQRRRGRAADVPLHLGAPDARAG